MTDLDDDPFYISTAKFLEAECPNEKRQAIIDWLTEAISFVQKENSFRALPGVELLGALEGLAMGHSSPVLRPIRTGEAGSVGPLPYQAGKEAFAIAFVDILKETELAVSFSVYAVSEYLGMPEDVFLNLRKKFTAERNQKAIESFIVRTFPFTNEKLSV